MNTSSVPLVQSPRGTSWRRFVRHFLEMVAAMLIGMAVLAQVWVAVFALLGFSSLLQHPDVHALEGFGRRSRLDPVKFQVARPACWMSSLSAVS
jgi:hypothetical protein